MAKILILGDLHAKWHDLNSVMKNVDFNLKIPFDFVIQVGDFGFFPSEMLKLDKFTEIRTKRPTSLGCEVDYKPLKFHKKVYAIDGNHEDHKFIKKSNHEEWKEKYNIYYQPRGSWMDIDGYKIGFMGGALHCDRRQEGSIDSETTNYILNTQINKVIDDWNDVGGMDVIITHSCPIGLNIGMEGHPALYMAAQKYIVDAGYGENIVDDCGDRPLTTLYNRLNKKPDHWFFGHFHRTKQIIIDNTDFMCVGSTDSSDHKKYINPLILNTKTNNVDYHDKKAMNFDGEHCTWVV